jgi:hypothetical protein
MQTISLSTQLYVAVGTLYVILLFSKREWLKAATWICMIAYIFLDRAMPPESSPSVIINSVLVIFLALVVYQLFKKKRAR